MAYDEFQATSAYASGVSGAALAVLIFDEDNPGQPIIGGSSGLNFRDQVEQNAIEESGNEGVTEIVDGRHVLNFTMQGFYTPRRGDRLPTRPNFIGKKYTIMVVIAPEKEGIAPRPGAGEILDVLVGCKLSDIGHAFGARGLRTFDLAGQGEFHYTGEQWFELAGSIAA